MKPSTRLSPLCQHLLVLVCASLLTLSSASADPADKQNRLKQIQAEIETLRHQVDQTRETRNTTQKRLSEIEKRIGALHRQLSKTQQQQKAAQQEIDRLNRQQAASKARSNQHKATLEELIRLRHQQGEQGQLKLLLKRQEISTLGRNSHYLRYFNAAQIEAINGLNSELKNLKTLEQDVRKQQQQLKETAQQLNKQQQQVKQQQQQRKQLLSTINAQLQSKESRLHQLLEDAKSLEQLVQNIKEQSQQRLARKTKFSTLRGKLPWPAKGKLSARFGQSRHLGKLTWEGVVIRAPLGNNVRAVADGEVVFADWLRGYGLLLILDHGQGYLTLYGQNQSLNKQVGDPVKQNEVIAAIGNSGGNSEPGLYFELRKQGNPVNPQRWCRGSRPETLAK